MVECRSEGQNYPVSKDFGDLEVSESKVESEFRIRESGIGCGFGLGRIFFSFLTLTRYLNPQALHKLAKRKTESILGIKNQKKYEKQKEIKQM